ncbi:MAG: efflux RND transporter periplasmic adaptor subunit [Polyangiales bacterium]|nr:efflux RND transporter periplasmic adaptor subunit [Myxococcales bacterium]
MRLRAPSNLPVVALAMVFAVGLALACGKSEGGSTKPQPGAGAGAGAREVRVAHPRVGAFSRSLTLSAALEAKDQVEVVARVEGPITAVMVDLGDHVTRGQVMARIEPEDFAARSEQANAEREQAEADLARVDQLSKSRMATPQALEQARTRAAVARAQAQLIGRQLRDTAVRAPFAGGVSRRDVSVGAYVKVGAPLFEMVSSEDLRLVVEIPEDYLGVVEHGDLAKVRILGHDLDAKITRISPTVATNNRTYRVEADVAGGEGMAAGMFVQAVIDVGVEKDAARVPRSAVFNVLGRNRVLVAKGGRAEVREVEFLGEEGADAVVLGVAPGDAVIADGAETIAPGSSVTVSGARPEADARGNSPEGPG